MKHIQRGCAWFQTDAMHISLHVPLNLMFDSRQKTVLEGDGDDILFVYTRSH